MNVNTQNFLKTLSILGITIAAIAVPVDFPYAAVVAPIFAFLGVVGYAIAHYLADPTTISNDVQDLVKGLTDAITAVKPAVASAPSTKTVLQQLKENPVPTITEAEAIMLQAVNNYQAAKTMASTPPTVSATSTATSGT